MIQCERTENGGRISVRDGNRSAVIDFTVSDTTPNPLTLRMIDESGGDVRLIHALADSLLERYKTPVAWLRTGNAELRYAPWIGNSVYRHSTTNEETLFTAPFDAGKAFTRICSLAEAMHNYSFVRSTDEDLQIFNRYAVLAQIRKQMKPFEFLSIKEECDYNVQSACVNATRAVLSAAENNLKFTGQRKEAFRQVLERLETQQRSGAVSFDTKTAYLHQVITEICLPSIVLFGTGNAFTQAITNAFTASAAEYIRVSQELLETYEECLKNSDNSK